MIERHGMDARSGVLSLIGETPLVRLESFDTGACEVWVKLESQNPGGSIKDRIGLAMIEAAERAGKIAPGVPWSRRRPATPVSVSRSWQRARATASFW